MTGAKSKSSSKSRKLIFKIITVSFPLIILLFLELGLRLFSYGGSMRLIVDHKIDNYEDYYIVNPFVGLKYFNQFKATEATNDIFLKEKPENGFRIFVLGSSTIYGFPYERNLMATRILHKRLQDAYPGKHIELINTSITAINSVTLKDFARQVVRYEPDALLIYAGHNEFYGAYGVGSKEVMSRSSAIRSMHFSLVNLRIYQLIRNGFRNIGKGTKGADNEEKGTLMKRIVDDQEIVYQGEKYQDGIGQFRSNLEDILALAGKHKIPVLLSDLVSNVKDVAPFGTKGSGEQNALEIFNAGQQALENGDTAKALNLLYLAKDLDPVRFRASEEINDIIYNMADIHQAILVPSKDVFLKASPGGLLGNNLLTEHVHPNIDGQFLLAEAFFNAIQNTELVGPDPTDLKPASIYRSSWPYTPLDSLIAEFKVLQLKSYWPFTPLDQEVRFRDVYKPKGSLEKFAFQVITDPEASGEKLHHTLGEYYEKNGALQKAADEYEALVAINPYWSEYLNTAANAMYNLNDLFAAEKYARESLKYGETYFSNSILGEIEFIKHHFTASLEFFEKSYELSAKENINTGSLGFLYSRLFFLYYRTGQTALAKKMETELSRLGQRPSLPSMKVPFEYSNYIPNNIKKEFERAVSYTTTNPNIDSALYYLERCLKINDCPVINLYIGDVLYQKQDLSALQYYLKAYSAYDTDPGYLGRLFYSYFVNQKKEGAEKVLHRLKQLDPKNQEIPRLEMLLVALQ